MEDKQVRNQMVVLDNFQLLVAYVFLDFIGGEVDPLRVLVEALAPVCRAMDDAPELLAIYVFQQKAGADDFLDFAVVS